MSEEVIRKHASPAEVAALVASVPAALRALPQWVCWMYLTRDGKQTKCPMNARTGRMADTTDLSTWVPFDEAIKAWTANDRYAGVGFVFSASDPYSGIDLDGCIDDNGAVVASAREIIDSLKSYTEISPSGRGVKIFINGQKPEGCGCKSKKIAGYKETEVYSSERFFTLTGRHVLGTPTSVETRQPELESLCWRLWPKKKSPQVNGTIEATGFDGDDAALIERAGAAKNGSRFKALWAGDTSGYSNDESAADLALCNTLAFYTGRDSARMDRLVRQSGLFREKWDERRGGTTYGRMTIERAIKDCADVYSPRRRRDSVAVQLPDAEGETAAIDDVNQCIPLGQRDPKTKRLVLSPRQTLPTAEAYVREFNKHVEGTTLVSHAGLLMEWIGNRYCRIEDQTIKHRLQPWLHRALRYQLNKRTGEMELIDFDSNPSTIKAALESIQTYSHLPATTIAPSWLSVGADRPPAVEILPCKSMNLHIPTGRVFPSSPALFTINALEFDYDPSPDVPELWMKFLEQLWGDDIESVELLQDWFGYCLTPETSQQKMLLLVGPRRSGKGTIGRILGRLVGTGNVAAPTTGGLAGGFGLQPLIDKSLAIVSDARFSGEGLSVVVERLLCISGEDRLTVERKFLESVTMKLPTRFVFLANELPRFNDSSNALAGRFLVLRLTRSVFGKEDPLLTDKLAAELPGILDWAIGGWKRLKQRGCFIPPQSSADAIGDLEDLASPVGVFVREHCIVGPGYRISVDELYAAWKSWCEREGRNTIPTRQTLGRDLMSAFSSITCRRGTNDVRFYEGITLKGVAYP